MESRPEFDEFQSVLLIMLYRVYDAQMAFLATVNPEYASKMHDMHARGEYIAPAPAISTSVEPDPTES